jgi:hypothetical protein
MIWLQVSFSDNGALLNTELFFTYRRCTNFQPLTKFGLQFWKEAMKLHYFPANGEPLLPKIPYVPVPSVASSVVLDLLSKLHQLKN